MPEPVKKIHISSWCEFEGRLQVYEVFSDPNVQRHVEWLFRGMRSKKWSIKSSLQRVVEGYGRIGKIALIEKRIIKDYRRRLVNFQDHRMRDDLPTSDLLAMMQHYAAPTRLLDWSYSPYWALFMALHEKWGDDSSPVGFPNVCSESENDNQAAIWVIKTSGAKEGEKNLLEAEAVKAFERHGCSEAAMAAFNGKPQNANPLLEELIKRPVKCAFQLNSKWLNERLSVQQGVFLCLGNPRFDLEENLGDADVEMHKLIISRDIEHEMLRRLYRMGIHSGSAFPGLEGFAKSLAMKVPIYREMPEDT